MKLVRYADTSGTAVGVMTEAGVLPTGEVDMLAVIAGGRLPVPIDHRPVPGARLLAPVPRPGKIFGSGVNYVGHTAENPGAVLPEEPGFFSKFPSSVVGPDEAIVVPTPTSEVDYEVELAVVIGRPGRDLRPEEALDHVFGYTVVNDVSARDIQFLPNQTDLGKGCDTFCPMGPAIVTADEIGDVGALRLECRVNGEVRQAAVTSEMLFDVPALLARASRHITLEPGDVVSTGTPAGCAIFRSPQAWLVPGDVVEVEIDAIGVLRNPVVAGWEV